MLTTGAVRISVLLNMTAEIAIINRSAVTLAADSAVTLTVRGVEKIYNAADKLFEISDTAPIGVMIYNNLDFMGVPLEVVIKEFRRKTARTAFASVFEAAAAFFEYLATDASIAPDAELQREHVAALLHSAMADIRAAFDRAMRREFRKEGQSIDGVTILMATVQRLNSVLEDIQGSGCFGDVSDVDLLKQYSDVADEAIEQCWTGFCMASIHTMRPGSSIF